MGMVITVHKSYVDVIYLFFGGKGFQVVKQLLFILCSGIRQLHIHRKLCLQPETSHCCNWLSLSTLQRQQQQHIHSLYWHSNLVYPCLKVLFLPLLLVLTFTHIAISLSVCVLFALSCFLFLFPLASSSFMMKD